MEHDKHISYLIDFIQSFELMYFDIESYNKETLLFDIMDEQYKEYTLSYAQQLRIHPNVIELFVTKEYNLLWWIWRYVAPVRKLDLYLDAILKLDRLTVEAILKQEFHLENSGNISPSMINKMDLSAMSKMQLCVLLDDLDGNLKLLAMYLKKQYEIYSECADKIYEKYQDKIKELDKLVEVPDKLYELMFENLVDKSRYEQVQQFVVLLISSHALLVHYTPTYKMIAIGCYAYDYYRESETQRQLNHIKCQNVLKVLIDPTRYRMLKCVGKGITSNKQIAELMGITPAGITYQMKLMAEHELIYIDEITKKYTVNSELITAAVRTLIVDLGL